MRGPAPRTGNRKAIASIGVGGHERLLRLASRSFGPFARRHGYDLHLHTATVDPSRPVPWSKIPILQDLLSRYEQVVWLDSDLVIVDPREDLPAPRFMTLVEHETKEGRMPNSGVWVLRSGADARRFLDEVWAQTDLIAHKWWENAAICRLLGYSLDPVGPGARTEWLAQTEWLDPRWNSIPDAPVPRGSARIRHYPGYSTKVRGAFMARDLLLRRR
jgi:hypothetical protein